MVAVAKIAKRVGQYDVMLGKTANITRTSTAKPAAFEAVEIKAVIGVGAPS